MTKFLTITAAAALCMQAATLGPADDTPALLKAAVNNDAAAMKALLDRGADPNAKTAAGATALLWSAGDPAKVRMLIAKGAHVNVRSAMGNTPLLVAASVDGNFESVRMLIEHGADVNAKNSTKFPMPIPVGAPGGTAVHNAAQLSDSRTLALLLARGAPVDARDEMGATPLMLAAVTGQVANVRLLLDKGADVNAAMGAGFTPLMMAGMRGNAAIARMLLDRGATVNTPDKISGATALHWASANEFGDGELVRLLLKAGGNPDYKNTWGESASTWSKRRGESEISAMLQPAPVATDGMPVKKSIESALALVQKSGPEFMKVSGCASCHNQSLPAMAVSRARQHGLQVDESIAQQQIKAITGMYRPATELMFESSNVIPDVDMTVSYALIGLAAEKYSADSMTTAMAHDIAAKQQVDGHWTGWAPRPPLEQGDLIATVLSMRAIQLYMPQGRKAEFQARIERGREWLRNAKARTNDERIFRLLGLSWSGAPQAEVDAAARAVLDTQRTDGGWGQLSTLPSDAYATGQALVALHDAGKLSAQDAVYQRGVRFLLGTQKADGSWLVKSRSFPFQPYKESGFPHGKDQWISAAGTSWAVMALANSL